MYVGVYIYVYILMIHFMLLDSQGETQTKYFSVSVWTFIIKGPSLQNYTQNPKKSIIMHLLVG